MKEEGESIYYVLPCIIIYDGIFRSDYLVIDDISRNVDDRHSSKLIAGRGVAHLTICQGF